MKKISFVLGFIVWVMLITTGCTNEEQTSNPTNPPVDTSKATEAQYDLQPMVMINGVLYYCTDRESNLEARCGVMDGVITSQVDSSEYPTSDNQSNFGINYHYQYGTKPGEIEIYINNQWIIFESESLSLDTVLELSKKGNSLSWSDFEEYPHTDIGSGLYVLQYEIDDNFHLLIGGGSMEEEPQYIRLVKTDDKENYIDIRTGNVKDWIETVTN